MVRNHRQFIIIPEFKISLLQQSENARGLEIKDNLATFSSEKNNDKLFIVIE